jgi:hypothetical protein
MHLRIRDCSAGRGARAAAVDDDYNLDRLAMLPGKLKFLPTGQQAGVVCARCRCPLHAVCGQNGLDLVPQRLVDNRGTFAGIGIAFVGYLPAGKPVLKDQVKRPAGKLLAAIFAGNTVQPSCCCDAMKVAQASRWASGELKACSSPSSDDFRV